jgi:mannosyltransferase
MTPKKFNPTINLFLLCMVLALGFFLRVHHLGKESLWFDEGHSIRMAWFGFSQYLREDPHQVQHPLYFLLLKYWIAVFGISEYSTRFLSALFGALSIIVIYLAGKIFFDRATGTMAALFFALSQYQVQYSQEVKGYSIQVFLALVSFYFFARLFKENKWSLYAGYLAANVCSFYIHTFELFVLLSQNLFFALILLSKQKSELTLKRWIALQAAIGLCLLPWLKIFVGQVAWGPENFWSGRPDLSSLFITFRLFAGSNGLLLCFAVLGLLALFSRKIFSAPPQESADAFSPRLLLLCWIVVPVIVPWAMSLIWFPVFQPRYSIAATPAICLLAAKGVRNLGNRYARWLAVALVAALSILSLREYFSTPQKEQWREAVAMIENSAQPHDLVLVHSGDCIENIYYYYRKRDDLDLVPYPVLTDRRPAPLNQALQGRDRAWLLVSHNDPDRSIPVNEQVAKGYDISARQFSGIKIFFLRRKIPASQ